MSARDELRDLADKYYDHDPEYVQVRLQKLAPTVDYATRYKLYRKLSDLLEVISRLYPDTDYIPDGFESRGEVDIEIANRDSDIEGVLSQLLPDVTVKAVAA
jgi:hypothetical protein